MTLKITQHHTDDHNWLRDKMLAESERLATPIDIGGPYHLGDPAHIQEHNRTTLALQTLADAAGCAVMLPPVRKLGDTGHESDHLVWEQALAQIQITEGWNDATGGTITEYSDSRGFRWRCHTFTQSGTLEVKRSLRPFRFLLVGGGGGGAGGGPYAGGGGGGGAGGYIENNSATVDKGTYQIVVGNGGPGGEGARQGAHNGVAGSKGGDTTFVSLTAVGGGGGEAYQSGGSGGGSGGGSYNWRDTQLPGTPGQGNNGGRGAMDTDGQGVHIAGVGGGGGGATSPGGVGGGGAGKANDITGTSVVYAQGGGCTDTTGPAPNGTGMGGNGIRYGSPNYGGTGGSGVFVIAYQVAPYNEATGGTVSEYSKDGKRYRVHTFTQSGTLTIKVAAKPFRVLVVGPGGAGAGAANGRGGGAGGGGAVVDAVKAIEVGDYQVTSAPYGTQPNGIGSIATAAPGLPGNRYDQGGNYGGASGNGNPGGPASGDSWWGGGGGGAGGPGGNGDSKPAPGGPGVMSDITGEQVSYGYGGGITGAGADGTPGGPGVVIISYEVGSA